MLRYLWENENATPVYVITGFKDFPGDNGNVQLAQLHAELSLDFPENYRGHIYFTHSSDSWKDQLKKVLENLKC